MAVFQNVWNNVWVPAWLNPYEGLVPAPRIANAQVSAVGDSFIQSQYVDGSKRLTNMQNFLTWWAWLDEQRPIYVANYGVSGTRTDQWINAQLASAVADTSKNVVFSTPVNDISAAAVGYTAATGSPYAGQSVNVSNVAIVALANIMYMCEALISVGKTPIVLNCIGATSWSADQITARNTYNTLLEEYINKINGVLIDARNAVTDGDLNSVTWLPNANLAPNGTPDGVHPSTIGSYYIGQVFKNSTDLSYIPSRNIFTTLGNNIISNSTFASTGTISSPAGFSGTGPTNFVYARAGGTSTTCVVSTAAGVASHTISSNGVTNPTQFRISQTVSNFVSAPTTNEIPSLAVKVTIQDGHVGYYGPILMWSEVIGGTTRVFADGGNPTLGSLIDGAGFWPQGTIEITMLVNAPVLTGSLDSSSAWFLRSQNTGVGNVTMDVTQASLFIRT